MSATPFWPQSAVCEGGHWSPGAPHLRERTWALSLRKGIVPEDRLNACYPGAFPRVFNRPDFLEQQWESGCRSYNARALERSYSAHDHITYALTVRPEGQNRRQKGQ